MDNLDFDVTDTLHWRSRKRPYNYNIKKLPVNERVSPSTVASSSRGVSVPRPHRRRIAAPVSGKITS